MNKNPVRMAEEMLGIRPGELAKRRPNLFLAILDAEQYCIKLGGRLVSRQAVAAIVVSVREDSP